MDKVIHYIIQKELENGFSKYFTIKNEKFDS